MTAIYKSSVPDDLSGWERMKIRESIGSPEEHTDEFWRSGNWGVEKDEDGTWEVYAIVGASPIKVAGGRTSFEECLAYIRGIKAAKALESAPEKDPGEKTAPVEKECGEAPVEKEGEAVASDGPAPDMGGGSDTEPILKSGNGSDWIFARMRHAKEAWEARRHD